MPMLSEFAALPPDCKKILFVKACNDTFFEKIVDYFHTMVPDVDPVVYARMKNEIDGSKSAFGCRVIYYRETLIDEKCICKRLLDEIGPIHAVIAVLGEDVLHNNYKNVTNLCANIPAVYRFVVTKDLAIESLSKYCNTYQDASEKEWLNHDESTTTCAIFGFVSAHKSGICRMSFGKEAYEKSQGAAYFDDLLQVRYYNNPSEQYYYYLYALIVWLQRNGCTVNFTELGATYFAAIDKIDRCERCCKLGIELDKVEWISIEMSAYFRRVSEMLHPERRLIFFGNHRDFNRIDAQIAFSNTVGSYAFDNIEGFVDWLCYFRLFLVREYFLKDRTISFNNLGKKFALFSLSDFADLLAERGWLLQVMEVENQALSDDKVKKCSILGVRADLKQRDTLSDLIRTCAPETKPQPVDADWLQSTWGAVSHDHDFEDMKPTLDRFLAGLSGTMEICNTTEFELRFSSSVADAKLANYLFRLGKKEDALRILVRCTNGKHDSTFDPGIWEMYNESRLNAGIVR